MKTIHNTTYNQCLAKLAGPCIIILYKYSHISLVQYTQHPETECNFSISLMIVCKQLFIHVKNVYLCLHHVDAFPSHLVNGVTNIDLSFDLRLVEKTVKGDEGSCSPHPGAVNNNTTVNNKNIFTLPVICTMVDSNVRRHHDTRVRIKPTVESLVEQSNNYNKIEVI